MYLRSQYKTLLEWLSEPPRSLIIVTGPRQVGKTTLVKNTLKNKWAVSDKFSYTYETLDVVVTPSTEETAGEVTVAGESHLPDIDWLVRVWEKARTEALTPGRQHPHVLVLDEIQKLDRWSDIVKGLWDADRYDNIPLHVVLLGSSPLLVRQGLQESLAGRFDMIRLNHWSFEEMNAIVELSLPEYLHYGGYPGMERYRKNLNPSLWFQHVKESLIETTIETDVLMMRRIDKPKLLRSVYELSCHYSSQIVSYRKMKGALEEAGNETTLAGYLELLGQAGLVKGLEKYAKDELRIRSSSPKLQVLNTALMSARHGRTLEQAQSDQSYWGRLVESAVGAHLHNAGDWLTRVFYWRENGHEVDFVVEQGDRCLAVEVKSTDRPFAPKGLDAFTDKFPGSRKLVVGSKGMPLEEFLQSGPDDWFSWSSS